jgi:hypothetical protein
MLTICKAINNVNDTTSKVFYTVNTQDFCKIENKEPKGFLHDLIIEAVSQKFDCCKSINDVVDKLGI